MKEVDKRNKDKEKNIKENECCGKKLFQDPEDREKGINQIMGLEKE